MGHEHGTPPHETLLRSAFKHGLVGMALLTQTLKIVEANAALGRFLGYPPGELAGMTLSALVYEGGAIPDALTGPGRPTPDLLLRKKTGDPVWAQVSTAAFQDGQGGVWGLAIVQDISGQKQTEEERRVLEVRVRQAQKMDAVGQLTGGIAHD